jgi:hypothetical protein
VADASLSSEARRRCQAAEGGGVMDLSSPIVAAEEIDTLGRAKWFVIAHNGGGFAFRFGPFTGPEAGQIIERSIVENATILVTADCGSDFDWDLVRELCPRPEAVSQAAAEIAAERNLLLITSRLLRDRISEPRSPLEDVDDLMILDSALKPFVDSTTPGPV